MKRLSMLLILFVLIIGCQSENLTMSEKIIKAIDDNYKQSSSPRNILIKDITTFKWDKMVIFKVGSSNDEVSKALGVEYEDPTDLMSGIVFVYNNKIVYNERLPYNPERPNKLWFSFDNKPVDPNCWIFNPNDAILIGSRKETDGVYYYEIKPLKTKKE